MKNLERVNERVNQLVNRLGLKEAKEVAVEMCQCNFPFEEKYFWGCVLKQLNEQK
jgi:hypothetical protein